MKKILIDCFDKQKRIALINNGELLEFIFDNGEENSILNNIYCGRIVSVLAGMQAAFVDIGRNKNAYLYYGDERAKNNEVNNKKIRPKVGDDIIVKVEKDETEKKGALVSSKLSYSGKFVVILPNQNNIGISKKISSNEERKRIKSIISDILPENFGIIVRTEGEGKSLYEYQREINLLIEKSNFVDRKGKYIKSPCVILKENSISYSIVNELFSDDVDEIIVNDYEYYNELMDIGKEYNINNRLKYYDNNIPIFEEYFIEGKIQKLFSKKVWLKSGGFIIIEETEACVVIDVNTGKFVGNKNLEKTIMKTNIEATYEIAKQLRLRNLSGMIIIDFIDIKNECDKLVLKNLLEKELLNDRIKTVVVGMTELCLMQITRKKVRQPLSSVVMSKCKYCNGLGDMFSFDWIINNLQRELIYKLLNTNFTGLIIKCNDNFIYNLRNIYPNFNNYINIKTNKNVKFLEDNSKKNYDYEILYDNVIM